MKRGLVAESDLWKWSSFRSYAYGEPGEQLGCQSSTTPSRVSLERRNKLLSKENGYIIAHGWDKLEIPGKTVDNLKDAIALYMALWKCNSVQPTLAVRC